MIRNAPLATTLALIATLIAMPSAAHVLELRRGVNTFPWLYRVNKDAPLEKRWEFYPYISQFRPETLQTLNKSGLDFIRVPVDPTPMLTADTVRRDVIIDIVLREIGKIADQDMNALLDIAPREADPDWSATKILKTPEKLAAYRGLLVEFAKALRTRHMDRVVLELMNEPPGGWGGWLNDLKWPAIQEDLKTAVRAVAPDLPVMLTGDKGGGFDGLPNLKVTRDDNPLNFYSFHYYEPMAVSHQGASWTSREWRRFMKDVPYPPKAADAEATLSAFRERVQASTLDDKQKATTLKEGEQALREYFSGKFGPQRIASDFATVAKWADERGIARGRILLGEFGALRPGASVETASNYVRDAREAAEKAGFGWAFFNYMPLPDSVGGFDMLRLTGPKPLGWDPDIVQKGLGLTIP